MEKLKKSAKEPETGSKQTKEGKQIPGKLDKHTRRGSEEKENIPLEQIEKQTIEQAQNNEVETGSEEQTSHEEMPQREEMPPRCDTVQEKKRNTRREERQRTYFCRQNIMISRIEGPR